MGSAKRERKIKKIGNKKFEFEWNVEEDTCRKEVDPIYANRHTNQLLGRGYIAGIDHSHQEKDRKFYEEIVKDRTDGYLKLNAVVLCCSKRRKIQMMYIGQINHSKQ